MAMAQVGELLIQLPKDSSKFTVKGESFNYFMREYFIQIRNGMYHYQAHEKQSGDFEYRHQFEMNTVKELIDYVQSLYPADKLQHNPLKNVF
jgi:hypothetical protein